MKLKSSILLLILDGWGIAPSGGANAIIQAQTPNYDKLWKIYPHTQLEASGKYVGLPGNEQGNSEVGHLNIGSGRIVYQDSSRISQAINDKTFFANEELIKAIEYARKNNSNLHLMGLLSPGGIHAHLDHLFALLDLVKMKNFSRVYLDLFTDGRDALNMSAIELIEKVEVEIKKLQCGQISTICGRYYAMDRDNHWERTVKAYNLLVNGAGQAYKSAIVGISNAYKKGQTDEYIEPIIIKTDGNPVTIKNNDSIIFFNFRSDRARQLTEAFMKEDFKYFPRKKLSNLYFVSMIPYGAEMETKVVVHPAFVLHNLHNTLAEVLSKNNLRQFHIAETEKYAHVTYFFNGGREQAFLGEDRLTVPSLRIATYDQKPSMSIEKVTDEIISRLNQKKYDFIVANFANPDMVGHTGNFRAAIEAIEEVDKRLGQLFNVISNQREIFLITGDHGNVEEMINPQKGEISTQHSNNPVPFILVDKSSNYRYRLRNQGKLADISPTILKLMNISQPKEMIGESLIIH